MNLLQCAAENTNMLTSILDSTGIPVCAWIATFVIGLLTAFYVYLTWHFNYWQKQGIKCDKPWPFWGTISNPFKTPQEVQDLKSYKKHGRIYGIYEGRTPSLHVAEPELLKQILVKEFNKFQNRRYMDMPTSERIFRNNVAMMRGEEWKQHRNIVTPAFTTGKMKQMVTMIEECAKELNVHLLKKVTNNEVIDVTQSLALFSLDVNARCSFGSKFDLWSENPDKEFVNHATFGLGTPPKLLMLIFIFPKLAKYAPPIFPKKTTDYFFNLASKVINVQKKEANSNKGFLHLMREAKAEFEKGDLQLSDGHTFNANFPLTHEHIVANSIMFILVAVETTTTTLSFALYELAINKDVQETLIGEIDEVLAEHDGKLKYEVIGEMQYLDMVISETLRKYPSATRLERSCEEDCEISGIKLKKGHVIGVPVYAMHHDEEFYPEPEKFDPERFTPENKKNRNPYTYLPFGYGPRNCIGMRYAHMVMKIGLVNVLKEFRVKTCQETDIPFIRKNSALMKPEKINLMFEKRTTNLM